MIKGLNHVGISVADLDRSIRFYRDLLGFAVLVEPAPFDGELYEQILALGATSRLVLARPR